MLSLNAARAAPATTGRDPQVSDRASGTTGISPTTPPNSVATTHNDRAAYLLAELRCAALRTRLVASEIDAIGIALRGGMIDLDSAVAWLHECDVLDYVAAALPQADAP
jgi:hypothetical protein